MSCIFMIIGFLVFLAIIVGIIKFGLSDFMELICDSLEAIADCFSKHEHHH